MNVIQLIKIDGTIEEINRKMTLEEMQKAVGGYIERVRCTINHRALVCDEEGLLKDKPINYAATELVKPGTLMDGGLRGDVLLVKA